LLSPSPLRASQELFASIRGARTTRLDRTQQNIRLWTAASIASRAQRVVTMAIRPSGGHEMALVIILIFRNVKRYFSVSDWTIQISLRLLRKLDFWRNGFACTLSFRHHRRDEIAQIDLPIRCPTHCGRGALVPLSGDAATHRIYRAASTRLRYAFLSVCAKPVRGLQQTWHGLSPNSIGPYRLGKTDTAFVCLWPFSDSTCQAGNVCSQEQSGPRQRALRSGNGPKHYELDTLPR
jgi:hypothetical protein